MTRSASTGCLAASRRPISTRVACTPRPAIVVSGPGQVDVLEHAALGRRAAANRSLRRPSASMASSSPGSTSRTNEAPTMSSAAVSEATTQPRSSRPSTSGWTPCGSRAAYRVLLVAEDQAERAPQRRAAAPSRPPRSPASADAAGQQPGDHVGVGGATSAASGRHAARADDLRAQLGGVHQVAVVAERDARADRGGGERRLGVLPGGGAGGGVPAVADGDVPVQRRQGLLVEHLGDQAEVLEHDDLARRRRPRCRPPPGRGAAARTGRSRSAWRPPRPAPRRRRPRTPRAAPRRAASRRVGRW